MLTKEEASRLIEDMNDMFAGKSVKGVMELSNILNHMEIKINSLTDRKPKREEINLLLQGSFLLKDKPYVITIREMEDVD